MSYDFFQPSELIFQSEKHVCCDFNIIQVFIIILSFSKGNLNGGRINYQESESSVEYTLPMICTRKIYFQ